ncbi:hypothetical protein ATO13_23516 [Stappia sp. 22II-S9-Z10]|nr:hypothetical protein ATO13_23516 [Stappia sp. 22II-S9-Z10]
MNAALTPAEHVAILNDLFRTQLGFCEVAGMVAKTSGIDALPPDTQQAIFLAVAEFSTFTEDNDPYGEHDFGCVEIEQNKVFWKIDIYADCDCKLGSLHPADPSRSYRVLTIMLAHEY